MSAPDDEEEKAKPDATPAPDEAKRAASNDGAVEVSSEEEIEEEAPPAPRRAVENTFKPLDEEAVVVEAEKDSPLPEVAPGGANLFEAAAVAARETIANTSADPLFDYLLAPRDAYDTASPLIPPAPAVPLIPPPPVALGPPAPPPASAAPVFVAPIARAPATPPPPATPAAPRSQATFTLPVRPLEPPAAPAPITPPAPAVKPPEPSQIEVAPMPPPAAETAGAETVVPRSQFTFTLPVRPLEPPAAPAPIAPPPPPAVTPEPPQIEAAPTTASAETAGEGAGGPSASAPVAEPEPEALAALEPAPVAEAEVAPEPDEAAGATEEALVEEAPLEAPEAEALETPAALEAPPRARAPEPIAAFIAPAKGRSLWQDARRRLLRNAAAMTSLYVLAALALIAALGPLFWVHRVDEIFADQVGAAPTFAGMHPFGTDTEGRDMVARVLFGLRISLLVGLVATSVAISIGVFYGAVAGFLGGIVDEIMMRIVDVLYAVPFIFFVIVVMTVWRTDNAFSNLMLIFFAIGAVEWLTMARIVRGQTIALRRKEFVEAARAAGARPLDIVARHIVPNVLGPVVVFATLNIPVIILAESFLSFLGLGVQEPLTSLGKLIADGVKQMQAPWMLISPAIIMVITLLALNFVGDGLRDALDPKER